jgi:hypothetical protein
MSIRFVSVSKPIALLIGLLISAPVIAAQFQMKVTDSGYLDTSGFSVILYQNTYHPIFVDEKNAAMQALRKRPIAVAHGK